MSYRLVDSKAGQLASYADIPAARQALVEWIAKQRAAGEPVIEQSEGQWSDSRVTVWIADEQGNVVRLHDPQAPGAAVVIS